MTCAGMIHDLLDITCAPHVCIGGLGGLGRQALNETQLLTIKLQCPFFTLPPEKTPGEKGGKQQNSQSKSRPKSRLHHFHSKKCSAGNLFVCTKFIPFPMSTMLFCQDTMATVKPDCQFSMITRWTGCRPSLRKEDHFPRQIHHFDWVRN